MRARGAPVVFQGLAAALRAPISAEKRSRGPRGKMGGRPSRFVGAAGFNGYPAQSPPTFLTYLSYACIQNDPNRKKVSVLSPAPSRC